MQATVTPLADNGIDSLVAVITVVVLLISVYIEKIAGNCTVLLDSPVIALESLVSDCQYLPVPPITQVSTSLS